MRTIITCPKDYRDYNKMVQVLNSSPLKPKDSVLSTGETPCREMWEKWAGKEKLKIIRANVDWKAHKGKAEYISHQQLLYQADSMIVMYDNKDVKTRRFIEHALKAGVQVDIYYIKPLAAVAIDVPDPLLTDLVELT